MSWTTEPWTPKWCREWWNHSSQRPPLNEAPEFPEDHPGWAEESHGYIMLYRHWAQPRDRQYFYRYYKWCEQQDLDYQWSSIGPVFRFRHVGDAVLFKLTWG